MLGIFLLLLLTPAVFHTSILAGFVVLAVSAAFLTYNFMVLKSFHLYYDDIGIWIYSGVLPWKKGVSGVKWRDLDEAVYFPSLGSWVFKSYTIRIGHRFTKSSEILLSHWARGQDVVSQINGRHQELVRANALS